MKTPNYYENHKMILKLVKCAGIADFEGANVGFTRTELEQFMLSNTLMSINTVTEHINHHFHDYWRGRP